MPLASTPNASTNFFCYTETTKQSFVRCKNVIYDREEPRTLEDLKKTARRDLLEAEDAEGLQDFILHSTEYIEYIKRLLLG